LIDANRADDAKKFKVTLQSNMRAANLPPYRRGNIFNNRLQISVCILIL